MGGLRRLLRGLVLARCSAFPPPYLPVTGLGKWILDEIRSAKCTTIDRSTFTLFSFLLLVYLVFTVLISYFWPLFLLLSRLALLFLGQLCLAYHNPLTLLTGCLPIFYIVCFRRFFGFLLACVFFPALVWKLGRVLLFCA